MYAVIRVGSAQFKVSEGDVIETNRVADKEGDSIVLDKVLMFANDNEIRVGQPFLQNVKVTANIRRHSLGEKTIAYKYRRRKDSSTKKGHRQRLTVLNITKISAE